MKRKYILSDLSEGSKDLEYIRKLAPSSLYNLVPYLTCQMPVKTDRGYSATSLFKLLKEREYTVEDVTFPGTRVVDFYKFFYHEDTKAYMAATQTTQPMWSSAVPIILYMYKIQHDIPYEAWDKSDPFLKYLLGRKLEWLIDFKAPEWTSDELKELQLVALTTASTGAIRSVKSHIIAKRTMDEAFDELPRMARFMIAQIWLYSGPCRHPAMITNPLNWDELAPLIHSSELITAEGKINSKELDKPKKTKSQVYEDLPW